MASSSSFCSLSSMLERTFTAFSAPLGYDFVSIVPDTRSSYKTTYTELDGNREEVNTSLLSDLLSAWNARQVDVAGLDETLLSLESLQDLLGESRSIVSGFLCS